MTRPRCVAALFFVMTSAVAQEQGPAVREYLLPDYKNVAVVDFAALRRSGVWDELEASALKVALAPLQRELGFPVARLDRLTFVQESGLPTEPGGLRGEDVEVRVLEGNAPLDVPEWISRGAWEQQRVGEQDVWRRVRGREELFFLPRPDLQVGGSAAVLQPLLEGQRRVAVPHPEVLSLLSGREQSLAYLVGFLGHEALREPFASMVFPGVEWPEGQAPSFLALRLLAEGDEDDPHLVVEAVLRHERPGAGVQSSFGALERRLTSLKEQTELRMVADALKQLERRIDDRDVVLRLDLGRARDGVGRIAMLLAPMLLTAREVEAMQAVEVRPEAKPGGDEKKGGG